MSPPASSICRSPANSRNLVNRAEMIEALKPLGFAAIQPEKLTFDEQALTFARADIIVIEFGAAMVNVMFCRPGTKVVEIIAEGQHDPWSSHLCAMLGLEYVVLFQRQSEEVLAAMPRHAEGLALRLLGRRAEGGRDGECAYGVRHKKDERGELTLENARPSPHRPTVKVKATMTERDPNIVQSRHSRAVNKDGVTVEVSIIRLEHQAEWSLEVVNPAGTSIVWDDLFASDDEAFAEFERTVAEEGMRTFLDKGNVIPFRR